jgi:hypothetical protein
LSPSCGGWGWDVGEPRAALRGRFEKGVDYIGDLAEYEAEFAKHAAIARVLGPYKLSLHSAPTSSACTPLWRNTPGG